MSEVFHNGIVAAIATYAAVNIGRILWPGNDSSLGLKNWFHGQNVDIKYWKNKVCFITGFIMIMHSEASVQEELVFCICVTLHQTYYLTVK